MKSKSGKKSRFLYPACQNRALVARKTGFCSSDPPRNPHFGKKPRFLQGFRSPERVSRYRNADFLPRECPGGIGIQKCRFLAKRRSANAFPNRLRRSEERNAAAFIPPLFNGTEERRKASPFAARFTPTRAATRWRVSPFTPPSPSLHPANAIGYAHAFALPLPSSLPPIRKRACHRRAPGNFPLTIK